MNTYIILDTELRTILPSGMVISGRGHINMPKFEEEVDEFASYEPTRHNKRFRSYTTPDGEDRLHERHRNVPNFNMKPRNKK